MSDEHQQSCNYKLNGLSVGTATKCKLKDQHPCRTAVSQTLLGTVANIQKRYISGHMYSGKTEFKRFNSNAIAPFQLNAKLMK